VGLVLLDLISDPVEPHIHGSGAALLYGVVYKASGCGVVGIDGSGRLRLTYVSQCVAEANGVLSIGEEGTNFCLRL
jgi:hypothetical protein